MNHARWLLAAVTLALNSCNLIPSAAAIDFDVLAVGPAAGLIDARLAADGAAALLYGDRVLLTAGGGAARSAALPAGFAAANLSPAANGVAFVNGYAPTAASLALDLATGELRAYWRWGWMLGQGEIVGAVGMSTSSCVVAGFAPEPTPCNVCCTASGCFIQQAFEACALDPNWCGVVGLWGQNSWCDPACGPRPFEFDPNWRQPSTQIGCATWAGAGVETPAHLSVNGLVAWQVDGLTWHAWAPWAVFPEVATFQVEWVPLVFSPGRALSDPQWPIGDLVAGIRHGTQTNGQPYAWPGGVDGAAGWTCWLNNAALGGGCVSGGARYTARWAWTFSPAALSATGEVGLWANVAGGTTEPVLLIDGGWSMTNLTPWLDAPLVINDAGQILGVRGAEVVRLTPR